MILFSSPPCEFTSTGSYIIRPAPSVHIRSLSRRMQFYMYLIFISAIALASTADPIAARSQVVKKINWSLLVDRPGTVSGLFRGCTLRSAQRSCNKRQSPPPKSTPRSLHLSAAITSLEASYQKKTSPKSQFKVSGHPVTSKSSTSCILNVSVSPSMLVALNFSYPSILFCFHVTTPRSLDNISSSLLT